MDNIISEMFLSKIGIYILILIVIIAYEVIRKRTKRRRNKYIRDMMKHPNNNAKNEAFDNIYEYLISDVDINKMRVEHIRDSILAIVTLIAFFIDITIILICCLFPQIYELDFNENILYLIMALIFFVPLIIGTLFSFKNQKYEHVLEKILLSIKPDIKCEIFDDYNTNKNYELIKELYTVAGFEDTFNRENTSKYIEYQLNGNEKVRMAEVCLSSKSRRSNMVMFKGICVKIHREKLVENEIMIGRNMPLIKLENNIKTFDDFERVFDLNAKYRTDGELRIGERERTEIFDLYKKYGIMFEISLRGKFMYIRFFTGNLFTKDAIINKSRLQREYNIFNNIFKIIEKLNEIL